MLEHAKAARVRSSRLEQGAEFARVLEHRSPLGSSMLVCNTNEDGQLEIKDDEKNGFRDYLEAVVRIKRVVLGS